MQVICRSATGALLIEPGLPQWDDTRERSDLIKTLGLLIGLSTVVQISKDACHSPLAPSKAEEVKSDRKARSEPSHPGWQFADLFMQVTCLRLKVPGWK